MSEEEQTQQAVEPPEGMAKLFVNMATGGAMGAVWGSMVSAWNVPRTSSDGIKLAVEALPSFRKMWSYVGGNAALFSAVALTYTLSESLVASVRGEYDYMSTISAFASSGVLMGSRTLKASRAFYYGMAFAVIGAVTHVAVERIDVVPDNLKRTRMYRVI